MIKVCRTVWLGGEKMKNYVDLCSVLRRKADAAAIVRGSRDYPDIQGRVLFYQTRCGVVVRADIMGLPRGDGSRDGRIFAFHIHSGCECSGNSADPFANADGHYDPDGCPHPYHAGDMPPLFGAGGRAFLTFLTDRFTVSEIIGKTVIIHDSPDDFTSQPAGNAGTKIACGVISRNPL